MSLCEDARAMQRDLVHLRRSSHREPELGLHLPRTQEKVLAAIDGLGLEVTLGQSLTSVTAVLRGARPGPTVLLRADMDALPVAEATGLDYASGSDRMHACGHDLHTAMLTGAAHLLASRADTLAGNVVFMFQPGEEGDDGAAHMIAAYGLHVMSAGIPGGVFGTRRGPILAASDAVRGACGHGSTPHLALDPVPAACEMVLALQTLVTRRFDIDDPVVVTVGSIHGGTASNVIPDHVRFDTTVRSFTTGTRRLVKDEILRIVRGIADGHGLAVDIDYQDLYPPTVNDAAEAEFAAATVAEPLGEERIVWAPDPFPGAEDFSRVLEAVPGAFLGLGAVPPSADPMRSAPNHSPRALFDDAVLADGAALYARLATDRLAKAPAG